MEPSETEPEAMTAVRFTLDAADFAAAAQDDLLDKPVTPPRGRNISADWFDTAGYTLTRNGLALSLSKTRRGFLQSLTQRSAVWETLVPQAAPDIAACPPELHAGLPDLLQGAELQAIFTTSIKRVTRHAGGVELHFESGFIQAGVEKQKLLELELRGPDTELYPLALALAETYALRLQPASLAARGAWMAGAPRPSAVKAGGGLTGAPCLDDSVALLTQSCLAQFLANWPAFALGDEVGAVHQMRVAMRRLRSVLGLFNRAFFAPEFATFRDEAKRIANLMGEARNWDVFAKLLQDGPAAAFPYEPGFTAMLAQCAAHRETGYAAVRSLLADPATTKFLLGVEAFLARHGWRNGLAVEALAGLAEPAKTYAAQNLARLHRKVRKRGKHLLHIGAHERHLVRIELKKLRYAADLFGGLFSGRGKMRTYAETAAHLQEELGLLNDLTTAQELLARLEARTTDQARAIGIVLGWCAKAGNADDRKLAKRWKAFGESKPVTD